MTVNDFLVDWVRDPADRMGARRDLEVLIETTVRKTFDRVMESLPTEGVVYEGKVYKSRGE
jgi:hypothetical protein